MGTLSTRYQTGLDRCCLNLSHVSVSISRYGGTRYASTRGAKNETLKFADTIASNSSVHCLNAAYATF